MPTEIKNADGADALKKQFSGAIPKKKQ